jgi:hypothetical protein
LTFRAISGDMQSSGRTAGEALDGLSEQLCDGENGVMIVLQSQRPDRFFDATQQGRLAVLMDRWRIARDGGNALPEEEQLELDSLVQRELEASAERTAALLGDPES